MQCWGCQGYSIFKPFPDETFVCCVLYEETVKNINIRTGVSPAIMKHGLNEIPCEKLIEGLIPKEFFLLREQGEEYLKDLFVVS